MIQSCTEILEENEEIFAYEYFPVEWRLRILMRTGKIIVVNAIDSGAVENFKTHLDKNTMLRNHLCRYYTITLGHLPYET